MLRPSAHLVSATSFVVTLAMLATGCGKAESSAPSTGTANTTATASATETTGATKSADSSKRSTDPVTDDAPTTINPAVKRTTAQSVDATPDDTVVTVDDTPRAPATVAEAAKWLDLRTFPLIEGAKVSGERRQIGELHYDAPGPLQAAFDFQRKALEERGWQLLPDGRLDGENPMADFTQHGFLVSVSANDYSQTPDHVMVSIKNHGNVPPDTLPTPDGVEVLHSMGNSVAYTTTKDADETVDAVEQLLMAEGWQPYGGGQSFRLYKQNAILLNANVMAHPAQPGKTFITYLTEQLSADIPVPPEVADPRYTDSMKRMHFDHEGIVPNEIAEFYNTELAKLGWKPTSEPVGDDPITVVYRNAGGEIMTLEMKLFSELTRVDVEHFTAAEVAALEALALEARELAQQEQSQREAAEAARMAAMIDVPVPSDATKVQQSDNARQVKFGVAAGAGEELFAAYIEHFEALGWESDITAVTENFGIIEFEKDDFQLSFEFEDLGLGGPTKVSVESDAAQLKLDRRAESIANISELTTPADGAEPPATSIADLVSQLAEGETPQLDLEGLNLPDNLPADLANELRSALSGVADSLEDVTPPGDDGSDAPEVEEATGGRLLAEQVAIPDAASDVERDADTQMVIYRSDLTATKIADFFREAMSEAGWSEIEDETFVDDELGFGGVGFEKGDLYINLSIQNGKPDSTSRVLVMGDGIQFPGDDDLFGPEGEEMEEEVVAAEFVGAAECQGTIHYGDDTFEMKHALVALRRGYDDELVTRLYICAKPFSESAVSVIAREDASVFDLIGSDYPECLELTIEDSYVSVFAYVDGASINFGGDKVESTVRNAKGRVAGRVHVTEPHDVFDTDFRFDVTFDIELDSGDTIAAEPLPGGLAVDERQSMLVPRGTSEMLLGGSPYMETLHALIDADEADVLTFYREQLAERGWQEDADATEGDALFFTSEEGKLTLELGRRRGETMIDVTIRQEALAREHGVVPAQGKAMLMLGNANEVAIEISIDGKPQRLAAEQGGRDPADALKVPIEPGAHTVKIGSESEQIDVPAGATWGVIAIPGGGLFADRVY